MGNRTSKLNAPAKSAVWFVVCSMLQKGILYITTPIFTRLLSTEQYGIYTMYQSWFSVISIICTLNLSYNVFHRAMVEYPDDRDGYTSSMQGLTVLITLAVFSTFLFYPSGWESVTGLPDELIFCMFLEMLFSPAFYFWQTRQRFEYRYVALVITTIAMTAIGTVLGVVAVLLTDFGALARIYPVVGIDVAVGVVLMAMQFVRGKKMVSIKYWRYALAFNLPLMPHYLSTVILNQADRLMIGSICGVDDAAVYGVAYSMAMAMSLFISSVNSSLIPWTYQSLGTGGPRDARRVGDVGLALSVALAAIVLLGIGFGPELMAFLAPESYGAAVWVIPPVGLSVLASMYMWLFVNVETYYGENAYVAAVSIAAAVANIIMNLLFLPVFGFVAAGWTTFASYAAMAAGHAYFMRRVQERRDANQTYRIRHLALLAAATAAAAFVLMALYGFVPARLAAMVGIVASAVWRSPRVLSVMAEIKGRGDDAAERRE